MRWQATRDITFEGGRHHVPKGGVVSEDWLVKRPAYRAAIEHGWVVPLSTSCPIPDLPEPPTIWERIMVDEDDALNLSA